MKSSATQVFLKMDLGQWLFQSIWCVHNLYIAVQGSSWNCLFSRWKDHYWFPQKRARIIQGIEFPRFRKEHHSSSKRITLAYKNGQACSMGGLQCLWCILNKTMNREPWFCGVDYFYFTNQTHLFTGRIIRIIWDRWTKTFFVVLRMMVVIGVYKYRNVGTLCYQIAFMTSQEMVYD